jgi:DNA polymerase I-like protein with 3'-5' exonuclease and polymerase domains
MGHLVSLTGRKRWFFGRRNDPATLREAIAYDPQCSLADIVNRAMINIWRKQLVIIIAQEHDALVFMYPEEVEDEIIPILLANLVVPVALEGGRTLQIPYDVEVGWNKGHFDSRTNPDGLRAYSGHDPRKRQPVRGLLDSIVKKRIGGAR